MGRRTEVNLTKKAFRETGKAQITDLGPNGEDHTVRHEHRFFMAMAVAMMIVVFIGFARSFFLSFLWGEPDPNASSDPVFYIHGAVFAAWMVLFMVQPTLIAAHRVKWHRRLGWAGAVLAPVVVVTGILVCLVAAVRPDTPTLPTLPLDFMGVLVLGVAMFGVLVGLALAYRRDGPTHKRLMLLATVNLLQAAVVRIPLEFTHFEGPVRTFLLAYTFILPLVFWDVRTLGRIHPATLWGGGAIVVSLPLRLWISGTQMWLSIARAAVGLVAGG